MRGRVESQLRSIGGPLSIFAAAAVCHVLAVLPDARVEHLPVRKYLVKWDAGWYLDIARHGYPKSVAPRLATIDPRYASHVRLDNAALLARRIYSTGLDDFDAAFVREERDSRRALERIIALAQSRPLAPGVAVRAWLDPSP